MKPALYIYSSCEGQTKKIITHIAKTVEQKSYKLSSIAEVNSIDLTDYRKVLIGASIRYGKFRPAVYRFIDENSEQLNQMPSAFIGVCLTARKAEKNTPESNLYMKKFNSRIGWRPQCQAVFAGALLYSRYNWWQTRIIQLIMKMTGGSTDTSIDIEFTDWEAVERFLNKYKQLK